MNDFQLIFEKSVAGRGAFRLPESECGFQAGATIPAGQARKNPPQLPELSEVDVVRHYTGLSRRNHGVDSGFYPLGSCTMKYNPKINEDLAQIPAFLDSHPLSPESSAQGSLAVLHHLERFLAEITGMDRFTLQPAAGAHGELTAMLMIKAYHRQRGESNRIKVLVPTSAHGTNPASAAMAGFEIVPVRCDARGLVDLDHLKSLLGPDIAALMLTNPNTLGLFEREIETIASLVHQAGGLLYYDGANLNAILGLVRPGDMGFDLVHLNVHKTFSTPHGGGGPGAGPVGVKSGLTSFLPYPVLEKSASGYYWDHDRPDSIGKVIGFHGNFLVLMRALAYILSLGPRGLSQVSQDAVLNANYLKSLLAEGYSIPYDQFCMHEFVMSAKNMPNHVRTLDIAKRLIDFGFHPPTVYFPLIVEEALMIEPTETESKETLDHFAAVMLQIRDDAATNPGLITEAPHHAAISRVDEARAARSPRLRWLP
jgi:glycine dehydrogenase subunit 2